LEGYKSSPTHPRGPLIAFLSNTKKTQKKKKTQKNQPTINNIQKKRGPQNSKTAAVKSILVGALIIRKI
jgi:hypothetical protein